MQRGHPSPNPSPWAEQVRIGDRVRRLGRTENVSISGAAVLCDANLRPGQELNLFLEIPQRNRNQPAVFEAPVVGMHSALTP